MIFIVGAPRSGTTLLRNLLNRHPRVAICHDTQFFRYVFTRRRAFGDIRNLKNRQRLIAEYLATERIKRLGLNTSELAARLMRDGGTYGGFFGSILASYAESQGKSWCGEKTPHHSQFTETLCEWFPTARILHLLRDPRDVVASLQRMPWASNSVVTNARVWLKYNLAASRSSHRTGYLQVCYERLVEQPDQELAKICTHLGEDYSPLMLAPDLEKVNLRSWSQRSQRPITNERIGKWRDELSEDSVQLMAHVLGAHAARFGYLGIAGSPSRWAIAQGVSFARWDAVQQRLGHLPASLYRLIRPTKLSREEFWFYRSLRANNSEAPR